MPRQKGARRRIQSLQTTNEFFGQDASPNCTCCGGSIHSTRSRTHEPGAALDTAIPRPTSTAAASALRHGGANDPRMLDDMLEKLNPEQQDLFWGMLDASRNDLEPGGEMMAQVVRTLRKCWDCRGSPGARSEGVFPEVEEWGMEGLEEVEGKYDEECMRYEETKGMKLKFLRALIEGKEADVFRKTCSDRVTKDLVSVSPDGLRWTYETIQVQIFRDLSTTRLFNVEKRFGFVEEGFDSVDVEEDFYRDKQTEPRALSFRQMMNDPAALIPSGSSKAAMKEEERQKRRRQRPLKRPSAMDAISEFEKSCREMAKLIGDCGALKMGPYQITRPPRSMTYRSVAIPDNIPVFIRQRFLDLELTARDISGLAVLVGRQRNDVRRTIICWLSTGVPIWQYGKKHVHEMRMMREYEYDRTHLAALYVIARQSHLKIARFFLSKGQALLSPTLAVALRMDHTKTFTVLEDDWEGTIARNNKEHPSVDEIIEFVDGMYTQEMEKFVGEWWKPLFPEKL